MSYNWYIIHTLSGSERKVKQVILEQAARKNMTDLFEEILVPSVEIPEVKKGKQVNSEKKILPGYILIKMQMTDEAWHLVKNIPRVSSFLGSGTKPSLVSEKEVQKILDQLINKAGLAKGNKHYEVGEILKVIDGPFESFLGTVEEVDVEKMRLKLSVSIFGRATLIDLSFNQVEKNKAKY